MGGSSGLCGPGQSKLHFIVFPSVHLPLDKLDEILAAAQQTISASESPGPGGLASLGKHRPKGFFATEVGGLAWGRTGRGKAVHTPTWSLSVSKTLLTPLCFRLVLEGRHAS